MRCYGTAALRSLQSAQAAQAQGEVRDEGVAVA